MAQVASADGTRAAQLHQAQATADNLYIQNGTLLPEEVALSRFRDAEFCLETTIDVETREKALAAETDYMVQEKEGRAEAGPPEPLAPNGEPSNTQVPAVGVPHKTNTSQRQGGSGRADRGLPVSDDPKAGRRADDFDESQHPREANGQFGEGGGGEGGTDVTARYSSAAKDAARYLRKDPARAERVGDYTAYAHEPINASLRDGAPSAAAKQLMADLKDAPRFEGTVLRGSYLPEDAGLAA